MADVARARRLAGRIKQIVATTIEMQIKDPRLGMVTITDVRVTGDLHEATVFYTVLGTEEERAASAAALESARGGCRRGRPARSGAPRRDAGRRPRPVPQAPRRRRRRRR